MHANIARAHNSLVGKFLHPKTGLFYEIRFERDEDFPSPEAVSEKIPDSNCGKGHGLGDCCLLSGFALEGILWAYRMTGEAQFADQAKQVFKGMTLLGTVSETKGFIPRGVAPGRKDYYYNTSVDQYTTFFSSVWRFAKSNLATNADRTVATDMIVNACRLIESYHDDIPKSDFSARCIWGDLAVIGPGRSERLLQFYRTAYDLSGDRHWLDLYYARMEEDGRARLKTTYGPQRQNPYTSFHALVQSAVSLRALLDMETDDSLRAYWKKTMADHAARVMSKIDPWYDFTQDYYCVLEEDFSTVWTEFQTVYRRWFFHAADEPQLYYNVRIWYDYMKRNNLFHYLQPTHRQAHRLVYPMWLPLLWQFLSALACVMLSDDQPLKARVGEMTWPLLGGLDFSDPPSTGTTVFLPLAYWPGVAAGVYPA
jgi:hypothetical protein